MLPESRFRSRRLVVEVGGIAECPAAGPSRLLLGDEKLVVDQRRSAIHGSANFGPATSSVERPGSCLSVKGIKANGVRWPCPGDLRGFLQTPSADTSALLSGSNRHRQKIDRPAAACETAGVYGPGLLGRQPERPNYLSTLSGHEHPLRAQGVQDAFFGRPGRPRPSVMLAGQFVGHRRMQSRQLGCVICVCGLEAE